MLELQVILFVLAIIVTIPGVIFWGWLLHKSKLQGKARKGGGWLITLILIPFVYRGIVIPWYLGLSFFPTHSFNAKRWHNVEQRYEIAEDLMDGNPLIGKTKLEIIQLLGNEYNTYEEAEWNYYLGFRPGLSIYPDELRIKFKVDKVVQVNWLHAVQMAI